MSLQMNFNNQREVLTEQDVDQLVCLITHRCRIATTNRIRSILTYSKLSSHHYGIFSRLINDSKGWEYCAGQSYTDELRTIRQIILKGK